ncbi:hypothetical protein DPSP01_012902 [Paraphaeosphaeria sporulosa]
MLGVHDKGEAEGVEVMDDTEDIKLPDEDENGDVEGVEATDLPEEDNEDIKALEDDAVDNEVPDSLPPEPVVDAGAGFAPPVPSATTICV